MCSTEMFSLYDAFSQGIMESMVQQELVPFLKIIHIHSDKCFVLREMVRAGDIDTEPVGILHSRTAADDSFRCITIVAPLKAQFLKQMNNLI